MIGLPTSARPSARAVRKMVSPSGIRLLNLVCMRSACEIGRGIRRRCMPSGPGWKPASMRKRAMECAGHRLPVDGRDQYALVAAGCACGPVRDRQRKCASPAATCERSGSSGGKKDKQIGIAAAQPRNQLPIAENHFGIGCARQNTRRRLRHHRRHTGRSGQRRTEP